MTPTQLDLPLGGPGRREPRGRRNGASRPGHPGGGDSIPPPIPDVSLAGEAERRYLHYALSVITSRALPDVRDGLKPVQRRILYAMYQDLRLGPDARFRKSAAVVGEVMGKYHPHGENAIYEAMVRMAQPFLMGAPLVEGHGNFGSADGDAPAAMRYTEARLQPLALELLSELAELTVDFRPTYDGTRTEPVVFPARFPNLLVNGSYGIAVGMATSIPPHNLGEVIDCCVHLIDSPESHLRDLVKFIKGPDFPSFGQLQVSRKELLQIYESGNGTLKLRGQWKLERSARKPSPDSIVITSIPYAVQRRTVVEKIAEIVITKKLPALLNVRDESTDQVRVVLELRRDADPHLVMAYLFKHTPLAQNVQMNLTCLVASDLPAKDGVHHGTAVPARLGLHELLRQFLDHRLVTVTRRIEFELGELGRRIHILEGFEIVFDALDQAITIVRKSEGKPDAADKLIGRFGLSVAQADAILELRLYRLGRMEISSIVRELAEKRAQSKKLVNLLRSDSKRWSVVRDELLEIQKTYARARRTEVVSSVDEPEFQAQDFILEEDTTGILCASGWVKRVREIKDVHATRPREGDSVLAAVAGSTRALVGFWSNLGVCYVSRMHDLPAAAGYGEPIQTLFKLRDGERIVAALSFDPRMLRVPPPSEDAEQPEPPYALAVTRRGLGFRFSLRVHGEVSTRAGRRFARLNDGDEVLMVFLLRDPSESVMCASSDGHALAVPVLEIPLLGGVGKGVMVMKLDKTAHLVGAVLGSKDLDAITVETPKGTERSLTLRSLRGSRAGRGSFVVKRGGFSRCVMPKVETPTLEPRGREAEA